jgi:hypothetical protein
VLGSLSKSASTPTGLDDIMGQMSSMSSNAPNGDILGGLLGGLTGSGSGDLSNVLSSLMGDSSGAATPSGSSDPLNGLLGSGMDAISGTLSKSLGFDVKPMLMIAAPLVMGLINKAMTQQKLDKAGVANLMETESKAYFDKGGDTAQLVQSALDAGDKVAAMKGAFGADWDKLRVAPLAAAKLVIDSSRSGPIGTIKELEAAAAAVAEAAKNADPASLIGAAFGPDLSDSEMESVAKMSDKQALLDLVTQSVATAASKDPSEVGAVRNMLMNVARKVAEAAKEGGFLGIGGVKVSKEEQTVLDTIKNAIGA